MIFFKSSLPSDLFKFIEMISDLKLYTSMYVVSECIKINNK